MLPITKLTYGKLSQYSRDDGHVFPLQTHIALELGVSVDTVARSIKELSALGLIENVQNGLGRTNSYFFLQHPWITS